MTYLQLINKVLNRLREDSVSAIDETNYSTFIGELVNQAKNFVESSWDWTNLLSNVTVSLNGDGITYLYPITGTNERTKLVRVWDATNQYYVPITSWHDLMHWRNINQNNPTVANAVDMVAEAGLVSGERRIAVHRIPTTSIDLTCTVYIPQAELSNAADVLSVPAIPVYMRAYALAISERGEDGGNLYQEIDQKADMALTDAIMLDSNNRQSELVWTAN